MVFSALTRIYNDIDRIYSSCNLYFPEIYSAVDMPLYIILSLLSYRFAVFEKLTVLLTRFTVHCCLLTPTKTYGPVDMIYSVLTAQLRQF